MVFVRPSPLAHSLYGTLISINKLCCESKSEVLVEFVLTLRTIQPMLFIWIFGYDILSFRNDNNNFKPLECFSTKWNGINFQLINKMRPNECAQFDSIWRRFSELFCSISFPETSACFIKERVNSVKKAHGTEISGQTTKKEYFWRYFIFFEKPSYSNACSISFSTIKTSFSVSYTRLHIFCPNFMQNES